MFNKKVIEIRTMGALGIRDSHSYHAVPLTPNKLSNPNQTNGTPPPPTHPVYPSSSTSKGWDSSTFYAKEQRPSSSLQCMLAIIMLIITYLGMAIMALRLQLIIFYSDLSHTHPHSLFTNFWLWINFPLDILYLRWGRKLIRVVNFIDWNLEEE